MKCSTCSFHNPDGFTFCGKCGSDIEETGSSSRQSLTSKSERKHVTVIFTDLSGYTEMEEKTGRRIFMHTGINTGLVVTGDVDRRTGTHGLTGLNINIASRLESLSRDDEILVGANTRNLARQFINFQALNPVKVKGQKDLLQVYKVLSRKEDMPETQSTSQFCFLGRDKDLKRLNRHFIKLVHNNQDRVVFILGDPGIGKSRLVSEFRKQTKNSDIRWLKSQSSSYLHETSYGTFLELLKNFAGIRHTDEDIEGWNKLEEKLIPLFPGDTLETLPYLATVLSLKVRGALFEKVRFLDSETLGNQIFRAFYILIRQLIFDRPLVLEFEDFHWADQSSTELLNHMLPLVKDAPLLILFAGRKIAEAPACGFKKRLNTGLTPYAAKYCFLLLRKMISFRLPVKPLEMIIYPPI